VATDAPPGTRSDPGRLAREVSSLQASLLGKLHAEMAGGDAALFAAAAAKLAEEFGSVTATAVGTLWEGGGAEAAPAEEKLPPTSMKVEPRQQARN